ncbi:MAG: RluA family pseudouridine synthase [Armatimonadota bacterium]
MSKLVVDQENEGVRLDAYLASQCADISRSAIRRMIDDGCVTVGGVAQKPSYKLKESDIVQYEIPDAKPTDMAAEDLPIEIVYEDDDLIVVNKPRGMVTHPAPGSPAGTVVNAILARCGSLSSVGGIERPGIVHRLDKDTSGLMVIAKTDAAHKSLQAQIQARTAERKYLALVWGNPRFENAVVDAPIGRHPADRKKMAVITSTEYKSRNAFTELSVVKRMGTFALIEAKLQTGRTHQVRVHAAYAGYAVVGDPLYSGNRRLQSGRPSYVLPVNRMIDALGGQALHAYSLSFTHPRTNELIEFTSEMPPKMKALADFLEEEAGK